MNKLIADKGVAVDVTPVFYCDDVASLNSITQEEAQFGAAACVAGNSWYVFDSQGRPISVPSKPSYIK